VSARPRAVVTADPAAEAAERMAVAARRGGHLVLSGGSTPRAAYEGLAAVAVDWSPVTLWWGDERCVPPDDERSNYGMTKAALLDRLGDNQPAVRRVEGERGPHEAADAYRVAMRDAFGDGIPRLDFVLMGLGADAHTASLFPGHDALDERKRTVVAVEEPGLPPWVARVTLTPPVFRAAREMVFLIAGEDKAEAVARSFASRPRRDAPASLVLPDEGSLTLVLDPAAAAGLPEGVEIAQ
jgi:6-phosphogluconolactonase